MSQTAADIIKSLKKIEMNAKYGSLKSLLKFPLDKDAKIVFLDTEASFNPSSFHYMKNPKAKKYSDNDITDAFITIMTKFPSETDNIKAMMAVFRERLAAIEVTMEPETAKYWSMQAKPKSERNAGIALIDCIDNGDGEFYTLGTYGSDEVLDFDTYEGLLRYMQSQKLRDAMWVGDEDSRPESDFYWIRWIDDN